MESLYGMKFLYVAFKCSMIKFQIETDKRGTFMIHRTISKRRFSSFQLIIAGFAAVDLIGALLLMLPIAAQAHHITPFNEALFTSTSALCVTGLVVQDTGSYCSAFGQSVILLLIQIGGLGVITVGAAFALLSGRKISLKQRSTM